MTKKKVQEPTTAATTTAATTSKSEGADKKAAASVLATEWLSATGAGAAKAVAAAGDQGAQLVEAWVTAKNADAVAAIANDEAAAGPARKAARRGLAVLKSRGVVIPERSHIARLAAAEPDTYEAWLLSPDASGTSVVSVAARAATGRYRLVEAVVRDRVGILQIHGAELSRTQLRGAFDDTERRLGYAPAPVPVDWARVRIASARADNEKSGALLPIGVDSHRELLEPIPAKVPAHPIDAAKVAPEGEIAERAARSATLHAEPEFRSWLPDGAALQELLFKIGEAIGTSGSDDPGKVDAAVAEQLSAATDRFFTPEVRAIVAARMKDAAVSVLARVSAERASDVLATASAIVAAGLITQPPSDVPFLRGFFQKGLAMLAARSGGQLQVPVPGPQSSGLVTPEGETLEKESKALPGEKVSPGGIILP